MNDRVRTLRFYRLQGEGGDDGGGHEDEDAAQRDDRRPRGGGGDASDDVGDPHALGDGHERRAEHEAVQREATQLPRDARERRLKEADYRFAHLLLRASEGRQGRVAGPRVAAAARGGQAQGAGEREAGPEEGRHPAWVLLLLVVREARRLRGRVAAGGVVEGGHGAVGAAEHPLRLPHGARDEGGGGHAPRARAADSGAYSGGGGGRGAVWRGGGAPHRCKGRATSR
mmetsp:Transcript_8548/g.25166  ORF Transcript_8548/g.25166 Transcript_8548/m.25166 type:complete len:228 (+) Transcript_8548:2192-2875(+)